MRRSSLLVVLLLTGFQLAGCLALPTQTPLKTQRDAYKLVDQGTQYLREQKYDQARAAFDIAVELLPLPAALDGLGCVAFAERDIALAQHYFEQALIQDSSYFEALAHLALIWELRGDIDRASEFYKMALRLGPADPRTRNNYAVLLSESAAQTPQALIELRKAAVLAEHPLIFDNVKVLESTKYGKAKTQRVKH